MNISKMNLNKFSFNIKENLGLKNQNFNKNYDKIKKGYFGEFGGRYSPEVLIPALVELEENYDKISKDPNFQKSLNEKYEKFANRPSLLSYASRLSKKWGAEIYLKREDLNHTGSHKINNAIGQALIAKSLGKKRLIAETGAGQHGVAVATIAAHFGFECCIYMGAEDVRRQKLNCFRMNLLGAKVVVVESGSKTLKDATNEAMRDWCTNVNNTHYLIGSAIGPHPFPTIVRDFQSIIGKEAKKQILKQTGKLPDVVVACVGGGSNAIGIFYDFINDPVRLVGVEAGGHSLKIGENSASIHFNKVGYFHGTRSLYIQKKNGMIAPVHSISAGLDYPGVGPEHAYLAFSKRAEYYYINDNEALNAFQELTKIEGIIPALESAHAIAYTKKLANEYKKKKIKDPVIIISLSGRGDKDVSEVARLLEKEI